MGKKTLTNYVGSITNLFFIFLKKRKVKSRPSSLLAPTQEEKNRLLGSPSDKDLSKSQGTKLITDKPSPRISPGCLSLVAYLKRGS